MLQAIVAWSIHHRLVVVVLAGFLLVLGVYAANQAKLDVFPEFAPPQVVIQTEAPGLSPTEVEQLVTLPMETAVNGIPRLDVLRSQSIQGLSVITVIFQDGTDIYRARQLVAERLAEVSGQLPEGAKDPRLAPLTPAAGRLVTVGFTSTQLSPLELRDQVQWSVRPRLLGVRGVAQVTLFGGAARQLQVQVRPEALAARNLTLSDVVEATRQASRIRGAGFFENDRQRILLRTEGQVRSAAELGETVLTANEGTPVRLHDVAHVTDGPAPQFGDAAVDGQPAVVLVVYKQVDSDTLTVTQQVEAELEKLRPLVEQQGIVYHPALFRQANFIEHALGNVLHSLLLGAILVALVLFLFLFNLRTALISLTAIPLSLLAAIVVLWSRDVSLNTLTLGGLAIAVGEVVDDAIIDVENIFRRLRENARCEHPRSAAAVVLAASLEVRSAVVYATFIVVLVFVPIFFLSGLQGRLFAPLGYAYVLAVLASLAVALTVSPALALLLLPASSTPGPRRKNEEPPLLRRLQGAYDWLLRRLDRQLPLLVTLTLLLLGAAGWALANFGGEFLPELRENHFVVHLRGIPGTALTESLVTGKAIARTLKDNPLVVSVTQQAGRAELGEDTEGVEYSELEVDLQRVAAEDAAQAGREMQRTLSGFPGFSFEVMPFLTERIKEVLSGTSASVAVKVYGEDLAAIDQAADRIAQVLSRVPGNQNVRAEAQTGVPELVVRVRPADAARYGLRRAQILDAIHAAYQGAEVGQVYDRNRIVPIVVQLEASARQDVESVANLWLAVTRSPTADTKSSSAETVLASAEGSGTSGRVQLRQVVDIFLSDGRFLIAHEGGIRRRAVLSNVAGRDVESFVAEAERRLKELVLPLGVSYVLTGEHEAERETRRQLLFWSLLAGGGIGLLLWMAFGAVRRLVLILVNLPFALVGGIAAVYLAGGVLNVGALVGFVTLFGITTRNSMMMISHWQHLQEVEQMPWGAELVFRGARERLAPVLMTALVTALGLLPIALGSGEAGREIEGPMAWVILGGLFTSTALNLIVLPVLYRRYGNGPVSG